MKVPERENLFYSPPEINSRRINASILSETCRTSSNDSFKFLNFHFITLIHWRFKEGYRWKEHQHRYYELIVPVKGDYKCLVNEKLVSIVPGQTVLIPPESWHEDFCDKGTEYYGIEFRIQNRSTGEDINLIKSSTMDPVQLVFDQAVSESRKWLNLLLDASSISPIFRSQLQDALLAQLLIEIVYQLPKGLLDSGIKRQSEIERFRAELFRIFDRHINSRLTLEMLARQMGYHPRTLTSHSQMLLKASPMQLFLDYRLEHAALLLEKTGLSIKEISYSLGFANPFYFSRVFKRKFKAPPRKWRVRD